MLYLGVSCLFLFSIFVFTNRHIILEKYHKFRELNRLVESGYKGNVKPICTILWVSFCMICKMYWIRFLHYMNNTIEHRKDKSGKHIYVISYIVNGKLHKFVIKPKKGPSLDLLVTDENDEDVSDLIFPFLGAHNDWHGYEFTPEFWDKEKLTFQLSNGEEKIFKKTEIIVL